ncbi:phosphonate ABC transporter, permease protein PhnE [Sediminivirga luteola]|uniref:ABC transporter permease n=1 Tax=Sediminivirga luteola TaxID=1774748 RepID=A0A8J2TXV6_9MICO|nr:phosphonate ABC transporter, permease protein PhnE [Sediminivirga luteola]MCI2265840.1 phosphonate ABC transporter, permease protein PhnE [Sediminivirga luteola]GGA14205.1 ABC transporter permease [Sediminivirga luteola]
MSTTAGIVLPPRPSGRWRRWAGAALVAAITLVTLLPGIGIGFELTSLLENWRNGAERIGRLLVPDWSFFPRTVRPLLETLQMAVIATAVGAGLSLPLSFWAARTTNPGAVGRGIVRAVLNTVRAVPDLLYAAILVAMVGVGALPGILALVLFSVGIIVKLVSEAVEATPTGALEAGRAAGGSQAQVIHALALPDAWPPFVNQTLYMLELNVRAAAVLGLVGAGGIGLLIDQVRSFYRYDQIALIIVELVVIIIVIEAVSGWARRRLV